jgi:hypothetical protein
MMLLGVRYAVTGFRLNSRQSLTPRCVVQPKGNRSCGECFEMFGRFCLYGFLYVRLHFSFV